MKSGRYKLLCLCLVLNILFLSACETVNVRKEAADTKQISDKIGQDEISLPDGKETAVSQNKLLNWKAIPITVEAYVWRQTHSEIQLMTWETTNQAINCEELGHSKEVEELSYSEDYFETKSLITFYYDVNLSCEFCVQDVQYSNGELKVIVEYRTPPVGSVMCAALCSYYVFLEIDEVIHPNTNVILETVLTEKAYGM